MSGGDFVLFLVQLSVMLACGLAGGYVMLRLGQPVVLGEMLGGILLGPTLVGWLAPDFYQALFSSSAPAALLRSGTIKLGMLFFLFLIGLEISFQQLAKYGLVALVVGLLGTLVPLVSGAAIVYALPDIWGPQAHEHRFAFALFIGTALANTANPVLARILLDLDLLKRDIGAMLMTATVVDDLVSWSLLAVVFGQFAGGEAVTTSGHVMNFLAVTAFFVIVLSTGRWLIRPVLIWSNRVLGRSSLTLALVSIFVLAAAAFAERLELHAFLGPFLLGIAVASSQKQMGRTYQSIHEFVVGFFVPIYFVSMGLTADFIRSFDLVLVAVVLAVACASKISSVFVAGIATGLDRRTALGVGFGMNARGAIGIILAALGREQGLINEPVYVALVLMAILTSVLAVPTMKLLLVNGQPSSGENTLMPEGPSEPVEAEPAGVGEEF